MSAEYSVEEVRREAAGLRVHGYVAGPDMLTAYAERIEADERAVTEDIARKAYAALETEGDPIECMRKALLAVWPNPPAQAAQVEPGEQAAEWFMHEFSDLNAATACLVWNFALALGNKLAAAEKKYGYTDGWRSPAWMDECRTKLMEHIRKGDPRDVAAYCAFLWHHGASTAPTANPPNHPHSPDAADSGRVTDEMARALCAKFDELGYGYPDTDDAKLAITAALAEQGHGDRLPAELCDWLQKRDLLPDTGDDGSFDIADLIVALNDHENALMASHPAPPASPAGVPDGYDVGWKIRGVTAYNRAKARGFKHPECVEAAIKAAPSAPEFTTPDCPNCGCVDDGKCLCPCKGE